MLRPSTGRISPCFAALALTFAPAALAQGDEIPKDGAKVETHGSGVKYSILTPGKGAKPAAGDEAVIKFSEWISDGTLVDSTKKRGGSPLRIRIGDRRVPFGMSLGAMLVGKGGRIKLTVPHERAYGKMGQLPRIPPEATMVYEVELVDWIYRPKQPKFIKGDPTKTKATESGLQYQELTPGKGGKPKASDIVELEYAVWTVTGRPLDGTTAWDRPRPRRSPPSPTRSSRSCYR